MHSLRFKIELILVLLIITLGVLMYFSFNNPFGTSKVNIDLSRESVVKQIDKLGSLETASYTIEKVIEAGQDGNSFQNILFGDKLLLIAHGNVVAGVDLYKMTKNDVSVSGKTLTLNLPDTKILTTTLDNSKTKVYDRSQGLLNKGDKNLETKARQAAESSITKAACESGILDEARKNAIERLKELFEFAGFTRVNVYVKSGGC